jgi:hypothetical protein
VFLPIPPASNPNDDAHTQCDEAALPAPVPERKRISMLASDEYSIEHIVDWVGALKMSPRQIQEVFRIIGHTIAAGKAEQRGKNLLEPGFMITWTIVCRRWPAVVTITGIGTNGWQVSAGNGQFIAGYVQPGGNTWGTQIQIPALFKKVGS